MAALEKTIDDREAANDRSREDLAARDRVIAEMQSRLDGLLQTQGELNGKTAQSESETRRLQAIVDRQTEQIDRLTQVAGPREALVGELTRTVAQRESDLHRLSTVVEQRGAQIEQLTREAAEREGNIENLRRDRADRSAWAYRMVEGLVSPRSHQRSGGGQDWLVQRQLTGDVLTGDSTLVSIAHPQQLAAAVAHQSAELISLRDEIDNGRRELAESRETTARLEAALDQERSVRARLEESLKRDYELLKRRLVDVVEETVPRKATVLMVSRGDETLLTSNGRRVWHFPQTAKGVWAGQYPAESGEAIAHLEKLRAKGADYLVFPATSRWWLQHYDQFRAHLGRYRVVLDREDTGTIIDLAEPAWRRRLREAIADFTERFGREPALLDWDSGLDLAALFPAHSVFSPPVESSTLAYLDGSIDVCVCRNISARVAEARRVASGMVLKVGRPRKNGSGNGLAAIFSIPMQAEWIRPSGRSQRVNRRGSAPGAVRHARLPERSAEAKSRKGQR